MKSVIELVKTTQGYSVVEDGHEVNKVTNRNTKQKLYSAAPKKFTQQNFTIYPFVYCQQPDFSQKYIFIPAKSQWFNLNQIHEIEKKALPEWFKTKKVVFGAAKPDKFEKNQQLYKKYRNYIIDLARNQYLSPSAARKGLAGDVCAIIRIHSFLQKNGLINYVFPKNRKISDSANLQTPSINLNLVKRKDCVDKQKTIFEKHFDKDHLQLLKKITKKIRPVCHLCEGICGVLWFEYSQQLVLKSFQKVSEKSLKIQEQSEERKATEEHKISQKIKIIKSDQPFSYLFRLCSSCFTTGILPVVLSHEDFKKQTVLDNLSYHYQEPKEKKKINEQNKVIEQLQKNKFNLKKTAEILRLPENELLELLMCLPVIKIEKLARIDPETETEDSSLNKNHQSKASKAQQQKKMVNNEQKQIKLAEEYQRQLLNLEEEEGKLYEQLIQTWLLKLSAKLTKLSEWEKSTSWFASRLVDDQKNSLASALKQKM